MTIKKTPITTNLILMPHSTLKKFIPHLCVSMAITSSSNIEIIIFTHHLNIQYFSCFFFRRQQERNAVCLRGGNDIRRSSRIDWQIRINGKGRIDDHSTHPCCEFGSTRSSERTTNAKLL